MLVLEAMTIWSQKAVGIVQIAGLLDSDPSLNLALSPTKCVTLGKTLNVPELPFRYYPLPPKIGPVGPVEILARFKLKLFTRKGMLSDQWGVAATLGGYNKSTGLAVQSSKYSELSAICSNGQCHWGIGDRMESRPEWRCQKHFQGELTLKRTSVRCTGGRLAEVEDMDSVTAEEQQV